ncbi:hypothetical protein [Peribacillus phoenicis]|uniref:hypothetical protein n=1 Tax=unclassified Peribacillus TaxID=2675266 RepID=UPI0039A26A01
MLFSLISFISALISFTSENAALLKDHLPTGLKILVPLSLTLYLFAYKERKDITYSYLRSKKNNKKTTFFIILTILISVLLYIDHFININSFIFDSILIVSTLLWVFILIKIYLEIFNSINIFYVFDVHLNHLTEANKKLVLLLQIQKQTNDLFSNGIMQNSKLAMKIWKFYNKLQNRKLISQLNTVDNCMQITSQILISKIKYNLPKDFSTSLKLLIDQLDTFIKNTTRSNFEYITGLNLEKYSEIYHSILRNIELLAEYTAKNGKTQDLEKIITFFKSATVGPYEFTENFYKVYLKTNIINYDDLNTSLKDTQYYYIQSVKSLTNILSDSNYWDDVALLRSLNDLSEEANVNSTGSFSSEEVFTLYTTFLFEAINKNDIRLLTDIVNLMFVHKSTDIASMIRLYLLCSIKAVELGHYKCAGHLIKMIVKNTDEYTLKNAIDDIYSKLYPKKSFSGHEFIDFCSILDERMVNDFMLSIPFSSVSFNYCFSKLIFIFTLQIRFIIKPQILLLQYDDYDFEESKAYIEDKIIDLHKEYGLVVLKKENLKKKFENKETI